METLFHTIWGVVLGSGEGGRVWREWPPPIGQTQKDMVVVEPRLEEEERKIGRSSVEIS